MIFSTMCFSSNLKASNLVAIIKELPFVPSEITTNRFAKSGAKYKPKLHLKKILSTEPERLSLEGVEGEEFSSQWIGKFNTFNIFSTLRDIDSAAIEDLAKTVNRSPFFTSGFASNDDDFFWQNEPIISHYERENMPFQHLPKVWHEDFCEYRIDVKKNPGYRFGLPGMWMQSCWRMWFGLPAQMYLDRERLLSFPDAHRIEELPSGVIFIELHEDPNDFEKYRERQARFRQWSGMDALAERADDINNAAADPIYEMETGVFPHGGVRLVTTWLDCNDKPTRKSLACSRVIHEWDDKGKTIFKEKLTV